MTASPKLTRVALYARLSVTTEESVSISRQLEAGRKYAEARGLEVVGEFIDDGVSASKVAPDRRPGWRKLVASPESYDAVIVWKVDRLARKVLDFLHADESLQERGAGIVAVEDSIDMTTSQGRAFATMLAVFAQMEAEAISARVTAARATLLRVGRRAGGKPPFGWLNVPNPDGAGLVLAQDPERIGIVSELAARALAGASVYELTKWIGTQAAPPRATQWHEASVESILRNPVLAGCVPFEPGRKPGTPADPHKVLKDEHGNPVVDESIAIISIEERSKLLATLDAAKRPGSAAGRARANGGLLSGLLKCDACEGTMHKASVAGGVLVYRCQERSCTAKVSIGRERVEQYVIDQVLDQVGEEGHATIRVAMPSDGQEINELDREIRELSALLPDASEHDADQLFAQIRRLKGELQKSRKAPREIESVTYTGQTFAQRWEAAQDVETRRELLADAVRAVRVSRGKAGRSPVAERVELDFIAHGDKVPVSVVPA